jgi:hypothetical protein
VLGASIGHDSVMTTMTKNPDTKQTRDRDKAGDRSGEQRSTARRLGGWLRRWDHANRNRRVFPEPWL